MGSQQDCPRSQPGPTLASSSRSPPTAPPGSVYRYGFDVVWEQMKGEPGLLETVVGRLGSADSVMVLNRYGQIEVWESCYLTDERLVA